MFYREYRPKTFSEVIGNKHIIESIIKSIHEKKLSHAYFFVGGRGTGKTTTARLFAKAINCELPLVKDKIFEPCNKCKNCRAINSGSFADLIELDGASNRGIDKIREIIDTVKLAPSHGKHKVYIIDEVHMLTVDASNAMLKTLEEPPSHACFVLCTTNPEKVISTIRSRCVQMQFSTPTTTELKIKLKKIIDDKKLDIDENELNKIVLKAKGAYRDAETILEQVSNLSKDNRKFAASLEEETFIDFINLFVDKDIKTSIAFIVGLSERGIDIESWTKAFQDFLRKVLLAKVGISALENEFEAKILLDKIDLNDLKDLGNYLKNVKDDFRYVVNPSFVLELMILEFFGKTKSIPLELNTSESVKQPKKIEKVIADDIIVSPKSIETTPAKKESKEDNKKAQSGTGKNIDEIKKPLKSFPYKKLLEDLKETNHSIYLILNACVFDSFDGRNLDLLASYSFHKERILSHKTREIIEKAANKLAGTDIILNCKLVSADEKAKRLTDLNVSNVKSVANIEEVFENVFGDDIQVKKDTLPST